MLDWPLVWDRDEETAIQSAHGGVKLTWSGPPLMPRSGPDRLRLDIAPAQGSVATDVPRLADLGARLVAVDHRPAVLTDPDGNEFTVVPADR